MSIANDNMRVSETASTGITWEIAPDDSKTSTLKLRGDLKPGWLGRLSSYMSQEKINVVRGTAWKCSSLCWDVNFEIEKNHRPIQFNTGFNPLTAFSTGFKEEKDIPSLKISNMIMKRSTRHGGSIYVEVNGKDCIGFLHCILSIFSFYSLFPTELEISTKANTVFDQFWLKGIGFSIPSDEDMMLLNERLARNML